MEITTHSTEKTKELAQQVAKSLKPGSVIALYGDLGSGKTTFTRFLVESLGFSDRVQSPTFVLMRHYNKKQQSSAIKQINHVDLYRLRTKEEVEDLGLYELLEKEDTVSLIEWPELLNLPEKTISIYFEYLNETSRKIRIVE